MSCQVSSHICMCSVKLYRTRRPEHNNLWRMDISLHDVRVSLDAVSRVIDCSVYYVTLWGAWCKGDKLRATKIQVWRLS